MAIWVVAMLVVVETTERLEFPLLLGVGLVTIMVSREVWRPRLRRRER